MLILSWSFIELVLYRRRGLIVRIKQGIKDYCIEHEVELARQLVTDLYADSTLLVGYSIMKIQ